MVEHSYGFYTLFLKTLEAQQAYALTYSQICHFTSYLNHGFTPEMIKKTDRGLVL